MQPAVHVVVGLITDGRDRWLVNRRPAGTPLAGWWEFPGGKCQPGEAPFEALRRELEEELGIALRQAEQELTLVHDYADKRVRLEVWRVRRYDGIVAAREGQKLHWVTVGECRGLKLLEADWPIVERLESLRSDGSG